jgi:hypothetical protein
MFVSLISVSLEVPEAMLPSTMFCFPGTRRLHHLIHGSIDACREGPRRIFTVAS